MSAGAGPHFRDTTEETPLDEEEWRNPFDEDDATVAISASDVGGIFGGRFRVDGELGEGAMGRVVTALDMHSGQQVALKILHPSKKKRKKSASASSTGGGGSSEERFIREVVALSEIDHPAVVKILGHDRTRDGRWWIAMELLRGETLGQRMARSGPMSLADAWPILTTLAGGLAAAHRAGFVHRDLKPDNVFVPESGRPACKILDFGFARHKTKQERITATGALIGTPRFMAPEILADAKVLDARADVYSLGVITFELLTGQSIYPATDLNQLFGCILTGRTVPLRSVLPAASPELEQLITEATARDPARRMPSAEHFAMRLAEIAGPRSDGPSLAPLPRRPAAAYAIVDPSLGGSTAAPHAPTPTPATGLARAASPGPAAVPSSRPRTISARPPSAHRRGASTLAYLVVGLLVLVAIAVLGVAFHMAR